MICLIHSHDKLSGDLSRALREAGVMHDVIEAQSHNLTRMETEISFLKEQIHTLREDKDAEIARLREDLSERQHRNDGITDDILISFGVRQPPDGGAKFVPLTGGEKLAPARTREDELDDDIAGLPPSLLQERLQSKEWQDFNDTQHLELADFLARRKKEGPALAPTEAPTETQSV